MSETVRVEAPLGALGDEFIARHVEVQLSVPQSLTLRRIQTGLREHGVKSSADALRWLLDNFS